MDYREFRLSRIHEPRFSHLKLLLGWVLYFAAFYLTEKLISPDRCTPIHSVWDDRIPFCEWFLIPYVFWYVLIAGSLGYFLLYNIESFKNLSKFFIITQAVATVIYVVLPNRQDLRPEVFPRENLLTCGVALLYRVDTSTNVCPSLHVACSIGMASVWLKEKVGVRWKCFVVVAVILICLSTAFLKQHSVLDAFAAVPVCLLAEGIVFWRYWKEKCKKASDR